MVRKINIISFVEAQEIHECFIMVGYLSYNKVLMRSFKSSSIIDGRNIGKAGLRYHAPYPTRMRFGLDAIGAGV